MAANGNGRPAKTPVPTSEVTKRLLIGRARATENGAGVAGTLTREPTLLEQIKESRESRAISALAEAEAAQIEAEAEATTIEAETKRAKAQVDLIETKSRLDELMHKGRDSGELSPTMAILLEMIQKNMERPAQGEGGGANGAVMQVMEAIVEKLGELQHEIVAIQVGKPETKPLDALTENLMSMKSLREVFEEFFGKDRSPVAAQTRQDLEMAMLNTRNQIELKRLEVSLEIDKMRAEREYSIKDKELAIQEARTEALRTTGEGLIQNFAPMLRELAEGLTSGRGSGAPAAHWEQPAIQPSVQPAPQQMIQAKDQSLPIVMCTNPGCGFSFPLAPGQPSVVCPQCGMQQRVIEDDEEDERSIG